MADITLIPGAQMPQNTRLKLYHDNGDGTHTPLMVTTVASVASGAIVGPGSPAINSYTSKAVDLAASTANQVLVAAPGAGKQIWVYGIFMMADTAAGTVTLQDEDDTALSGTIALSDEGGFVVNPSGNFAMPWIKVATNKALEADTGACTVDGIITYAIVSI